MYNNQKYFCKKNAVKNLNNPMKNTRNFFNKLKEIWINIAFKKLPLIVMQNFM